MGTECMNGNNKDQDLVGKRNDKGFSQLIYRGINIDNDPYTNYNDYNQFNSYENNTIYNNLNQNIPNRNLNQDKNKNNRSNSLKFVNKGKKNIFIILQ